MSENNNNQGKTQIFRTKSLERIESPESLHDYLRVTSPGVWMALGAVIALLIGAILWGIFGRIESNVPVAVMTKEQESTCLVPYERLTSVLEYGLVTVDGKEYALRVTVDNPDVITADTDVYVRLAGQYELGDLVVSVPLKEAMPEEGIVTGKLVTERLNPLSLLFK